MRRFILIVGIISLAAAIFLGGMFVGKTADFFRTLWTTSYLDKVMSDALTTFGLIHMLDDNKIEEAKANLNLKLDGQIMEIGMLVPEYGDTKNGILASRVLSRIGKHRQGHPASTSRKDVDAAVQSYLTRAMADQEHNDKQNKPAQATAEPAPGR